VLRFGLFQHFCNVTEFREKSRDVIGGHRLLQQSNGRLKVSKAKVKAEERLAGKYLIAASDPAISAEDTALGYFHVGAT
jgi:hypothetical protein